VIDFSCPKCGTAQQAPVNAAGQKVACTKCGQRLQVPAPLVNHTVMGVAGQAGAAVANDKWYYASGGQACGPVSWAQLQQMAACGQL
jgi:hypothetical protein